MNERGERVIAPGYDDARAFSEGRAAVRTEGRWGFIDEAGTVLRGPDFDEVEAFEGGVARVWVGELMGYIGTDGQYVWIPAQ